MMHPPGTGMISSLYRWDVMAMVIATGRIMTRFSPSPDSGVFVSSRDAQLAAASLLWVDHRFILPPLEDATRQISTAFQHAQETSRTLYCIFFSSYQTFSSLFVAAFIICFSPPFTSCFECFFSSPTYNKNCENL